MKTIVIYEGGQEHVLTAAKLRTPLQSGGTCDWVPEDETELVTKYVSENGTYNASSDNAYGYSSVTVNVPGGEGSADSSGYPTYIPPTETTPSSGVPSGGIGSSIIGTDPETGNEEYIGVDSTGTIVKAPIPTSIVLVTPPTKMDYNDGESIDLSGAVVVAKMADGSTWTDADYPNGHVSCTPDPATADESATHQYLPTNVSQKGAILDSPEIGAGEGKTFIKLNSDPGYYSIETIGSYAIHRGPALVSLTYEGAIYDVYEDGVFSSRVSPIGVQFEGSTFYINTGDWYKSNPPITYTSDSEYLASIGARGGGTNTQTITLNWARPGDGKVLSTTMEIEVRLASSENEDEEGGGAGHSF